MLVATMMLADMLQLLKFMKRLKKTVKKSAEKLEYEKILGECHDGEYYKLQMKDGSVKIVAKSEIEKKTKK